jgi:hypothetical protein
MTTCHHQLNPANSASFTINTNIASPHRTRHNPAPEMNILATTPARPCGEALAIGSAMQHAIRKIMKSYPNLGTSGLWTSAQRSSHAFRQERALMKTDEFFAEVLSAGAYLAFHNCWAQRHQKSVVVSSMRLAAAGSQALGLPISAGAIVCAARGMGYYLTVADVPTSHGGNLLRDVRVAPGVNAAAGARHYADLITLPADRDFSGTVSMMEAA